MRALLPAALLALFAGWCGTFYHGAAGGAVAVAHLCLLAAAAWGWRGWDPLRLGERGRILPPLLWTAALLALRASPVPRAGWVAVALLPALLALPAAVARAWADAPARRTGALAVVLVGGAAGAAALAGMVAQGSSRAAQPLGQALILAEVLAVLLPLALVLALEPRAGGRGARGAAAVALLLTFAALVAARSISGTAGAAVGVLVALPRRRRAWALLPLALGLLVLGPRVLRVARGEDSSLLARRAYWAAGVRGIAARPLLGWGPGSTPWTLPPLVRPVPGENPPGEVVSDLHALVLQLPYETGLAGLAAAAALGIAFARARRRRAPATDGAAALHRAGVAGVAAGVTTLLAGPTLGTLAPWVALAVAAGLALAAEEEGRGETAADAGEVAAAPSPAGSALSPGLPAPRGPGARAAAHVGWIYAAVALLLLLPVDGAQLAYDAARQAPAARARRLLQLAAELDPELPLYRARLGWLAPTAAERALELERAAAGAPGVAALQLAAGWAAAAAGRPTAAPLLRRACNADPLAGVAPFLLAMQAPHAPAAPLLAARALLADPTLLAAVDWQRAPGLLDRSLATAAAWPGIDAGFRAALAWVAPTLPADGAFGTLRVTADETPATALSLYAFRRLPWPATLATITVRAEAATRIQLLPASSLRTSAAWAFPAECEAAPVPVAVAR